MMGRIAFLRSLRFWAFWVLALAIVLWYWATDPDGGSETLMRIQHAAWILVLSGPVYLLRRAFFPEARSHELARIAMGTPTGAGLVMLGLCILTAVLFLVFAGRAAAAVPPRAEIYLPVLAREIASAWPALKVRSVLAAQVEQETCPSLTSPKCWNPRAELRTSREYGFGLGQLTLAYREDGSERFNAWREVRAQDAELARWLWADRYDARLQLRALVVTDRGCFARLRPLAADDLNALALCDAAYNGGFGGVLTERRLCAAAPACDPRVWFGHVERCSTKSRQKWRGYGASAFDINRGHVKAVMIVRRPKYIAWWKEMSS